MVQGLGDNGAEQLVEPVDAVTFSRADFGVLEDHKHLAPLLERARDAARRKARRSGVDADRAEEQLRLEIDARLAKVVDVRGARLLEAPS